MSFLRNTKKKKKAGFVPAPPRCSERSLLFLRNIYFGRPAERTTGPRINFEFLERRTEKYDYPPASGSNRQLQLSPQEPRILYMHT